MSLQYLPFLTFGIVRTLAIVVVVRGVSELLRITKAVVAVAAVEVAIVIEIVQIVMVLEGVVVCVEFMVSQSGSDSRRRKSGQRSGIGVGNWIPKLQSTLVAGIRSQISEPKIVVRGRHRKLELKIEGKDWSGKLE